MYTINFKIGASDLNGKGVLRFGSLLDYMQDCSGFQLLTLDTLQEYFKKHNIGMYFVSRQLDIVRLPKYCEKITISTGVYECKTIYGFRNTMVYGEEGDLCVKSYAVGAFIDLTTAKPLKMPEEIIKSIPMQERIEMEYLSRKITVPSDTHDVTVQTSETMPVRKYHIDANGHVNNARYVDIAEEILPEDFNVKRIRIDYRVPAKPGDSITPVAYLFENKIITDLRTGDVSCAVVEFSS